MDIHQNARHTPAGREVLIHRVLRQLRSRRSVVAEAGFCTKTVSEWVRRYQAEGRTGLQDRSCRPHQSPWATSPGLVRCILVRALPAAVDRQAHCPGVLGLPGHGVPGPPATEPQPVPGPGAQAAGEPL